MAAYTIGKIVIHDLEKYKEYAAQVPATIAAHGGRYLVRGGDLETLEGSWDKTRVVVLEFESIEALKGWYYSEEYQKILPIRLAASEGDMVMVEGYLPAS